MIDEIDNTEEIRRICKEFGCAPSQWTDYKTLENNQKMGLSLCDRCKGTGNELFSMYRKCTDCEGKGWNPKATVLVTRWVHPEGPSDLILLGAPDETKNIAYEYWPENWDQLIGTEEQMQEYTFKTLREFES